uniref:Uncharacterized protein n=1 Tax=Caenorhabditis japonica TaxID=281687 RepID=A0A8R1IMQ8_CAEJA
MDFQDNETVLIPITVSRVASIDVFTTVELKSSQKNSPLVHLPVGAQIQLNVIPRDVRGRILAAASTSINFRPHRFDLTDIIATNNNLTLAITLKTAGETVLRIGDATNSQVATFIRLSAHESLLPQSSFPYENDLLVSDVICFDPNVATNEESRWSYQSSNVGMVKWLDEHKGVAQLTKPGDAFIKLHTDKQTYHSKIVIHQPHSLVFPEENQPQHIVNDDSSFFQIPVTTITNNTNSGKIRSIYGQCADDSVFDHINFPFECHVTFVRGSKTLSAVNWLIASPVFSKDFGYGCVVRRFDSSLTTSNLVIPDELVNDKYLARLTAKWVYDGSVHTGEAKLDVPFHFAFSVEEKKLVFSNMDQREAALSIWAPAYDVKHIVVKSCDGDIVTLQHLSRASDKHSAKANIFYNVRLNVKSAALFPEFTKRCEVEVTNTETMQTVMVPVTVELLDETAKQVYNALESRGVIDVLLILAHKYSYAIPTLLWTCFIGIIILVVAIYLKMKVFDKTGSFGDVTLNNATNHTSMASSLNSSNVSLREPVFRSTPIAGSPSLHLQNARERLRQNMGSSGDSRLWSY